MGCKDGTGCGKVERALTIYDVLDDAIGAWRDERDAKRQFAFDMAARQGEIAEKVMGNLMKLADVLSFGERRKEIVDAEFPGDGFEDVEPRHPRACAHFTAVDDALAQIAPEARKHMLASLRVDGEAMVASLLELFFADLEAKKAPPMPPPTPLRGV